MIPVTLNRNCRGLWGYPATIERFEPPYFFHVRPQGCADLLRVTPGHFQEEELVVALYRLERPVVDERRQDGEGAEFARRFPYADDRERVDITGLAEEPTVRPSRRISVVS